MKGTLRMLRIMFSTASVAIVGVIFVVRRTLVLRSAESLASHPDNAVTLRHWKSGYIGRIRCARLWHYLV